MACGQHRAASSGTDYKDGGESGVVVGGHITVIFQLRFL